MRKILLVTALACAACAPSYDDRLRAELQPFVGRSVADYMAQTATFSEGAVNLANGNRVFIFRDARLVTMPGYAAGPMVVPTVSGSMTCTRSVEAAPAVVNAREPKDFRIVSITASGGC